MAGTAVDRAEAHRRLLAQATESLGVATEHDIRDYFRLTPHETRAGLAALVEDGTVSRVKVAGWERPGYLHKNAKLPRDFSARRC